MWIQRIRIRIRNEVKIHHVSQNLFGNLFDDNNEFSFKKFERLFFNDYFNYNSNFYGQPTWEILVFAQIYAKFTKQN